MLGVAWFRLAGDERCRRWLRWPTRFALASLVLVGVGVASGFASYRACEDRVATWVASDLLRGEPFTAWGGYRGWGDSASIFRRVGAKVSEDGSGSSRGAMLGDSHPILPFVVRVDYSTDERRRSGARAFVCLFGRAWPLASAEWLNTVDRQVLAITTLPWAWFGH